MMRRYRWIIGACAVGALTAGAWAQRGPNAPGIGFAYPSGGQRGRTVEVSIGGQYLGKTEQILISGEGVTAELLEHIRPPSGKELQTMRELWRKAVVKKRAETPKGKWPRRPEIRKLFEKMAKEKGVTDKQVAAFHTFNKRRADKKRQPNPQLNESLRVRIALAADAKLGIRELRVRTAQGLSNAIRFAVGELPELREAEPNNTRMLATAVPSLPILLNGQITPGDVDRFGFRAVKGQPLVVRVSARALVPYLADAVPGWFQAVVALYDAAGREVAYVDDYRFDPDPVLRVVVPADGEYTLEIRDAIYRGREDFVYRIALGELPFISSVFPLGGRRGGTADVTLEGWNLPRSELRVDLTSAELGRMPLRVRQKAWTSNAVPFAAGDLAESVEAEPNDSAADAAAVTLPLTVNGRIDRPGDWDVVRFKCAKGEKIVAEVHARRLGSPLDSLLRLTDAAGKLIAMNDDCVDEGEGLCTHHADSKILATIPAAGDYLLWIGDTQAKGGPAYGYRLRISPPRPDFELRVAPSAINVRGGRTVPITVFALRRDGFSGEIALELKDAPKGYKLSGARVPAGQDKIRLTLTVPQSKKASLVPLTLEGLAKVGIRQVRRKAVAADDTMQAFLWTHLVTTESWSIAIMPVRGRPPSVRFTGDTTVKLKPGATTTVRAVATRVFGSNTVEFELSDPPAGVALQKATSAAGAITLTLRADAKAAKPGVSGNLIINAFLKRRWKGKDGKFRTRRTPIGVLPALPFEIIRG